MTTLITKAVITINKNYNCQEDANEYEQGIKMPGRTVTGESQHPQGGLGVLLPMTPLAPGGRGAALCSCEPPAPSRGRGGCFSAQGCLGV